MMVSNRYVYIHIYIYIFIYTCLYIHIYIHIHTVQYVLYLASVDEVGTVSVDGLEENLMLSNASQNFIIMISILNLKQIDQRRQIMHNTSEKMNV